MDKDLSLIIGKFPRKRTRIITLYNADGDFRQLCSDYILSIHSIEALRKDPQHDKEIGHDYEEICAELEQELFRILGKRELEL